MDFISRDVEAGKIKGLIDQMLMWVEQDGFRVPLLEGALVIEDFLDSGARQLLEGQIYGSGSDLTKVYRTSRTGFGDNEINISNADIQIPLIGELRIDLDEFLRQIFPGELSDHAFQLRELTPKSSGHSRHVDYEKGFDMLTKKGEKYAITSVSLSLPISRNDGRAPVFIMEPEDGEVRQGKPGSLAIFGPTIYHSHPPTVDHTKPYLWLVTQAFVHSVIY